MPPPPVPTVTVQGEIADNEQLRKTRKRLVEQFAASAKLTGDAVADAASKQKIHDELPHALRQADSSYSEDTRTKLIQAVIDELYGFGPIQPLLDDPTITEVMVNRVDRVYVERNGKPMRTDI